MLPQMHENSTSVQIVVWSVLLMQPSWKYGMLVLQA